MRLSSNEIHLQGSMPWWLARERRPLPGHLFYESFVCRFDTVSAGALIFSDQFLQISSTLPTEFVYGLGEHRKPFLKEMKDCTDCENCDENEINAPLISDLK